MDHNDMFREKYGLLAESKQQPKQPKNKQPKQQPNTEPDLTKYAAIILGLILIAIGTYLA